jgi:hypothetical protein
MIGAILWPDWWWWWRGRRPASPREPPPPPMGVPRRAASRRGGPFGGRGSTRGPGGRDRGWGAWGGTARGYRQMASGIANRQIPEAFWGIANRQIPEAFWGIANRQIPEAFCPLPGGAPPAAIPERERERAVAEAIGRLRGGARGQVHGAGGHGVAAHHAAGHGDWRAAGVPLPGDPSPPPPPTLSPIRPPPPTSVR